MGTIHVVVAALGLQQILPANIFWAVITIVAVWLWIHSSSGMSLRRKTAISSWQPSEDGTIYAKQPVDMTNSLEYIKKYKEKFSGKHLTVTHLVGSFQFAVFFFLEGVSDFKLGKAVALALTKSPSLNGRLLFGRFVPNKTIDICFLVATDDGKNLAPKTLKEVDKKTLGQIAAELSEGTTKIRSNTDDEFKKNMDLVKMLPTFMLSYIAKFIGFISGDLALGIPAIGLKARNFGSCMITNVGVFGVEEAYAPFTPFAKVPLLLLVGAIKDTPVVREGQIVIRPVLNLMATLDHRFVDGFDGALVAKHVKELLENPDRLDSAEIPQKKN